MTRGKLFIHIRGSIGRTEVLTERDMQILIATRNCFAENHSEEDIVKLDQVLSKIGISKEVNGEE